MRIIILLLGFLFLSINGTGQISPDAELLSKLDGKEKFNDIKWTVLSHFENKLSLLNPTDSLGRKKIMRQMKMWNRKFWIDENYVGVNGKVQNRANIDATGLEQTQRMQTDKPSSRNQPLDWINQGPFNGDDGVGRIDVIVPDPNNSNIIYAGSPNGGLFKSTNSGANWVAISTFLPSLGISGIAIHPSNSAIIYVLTGENNTNGYFGNDYLSSSKGVYKTNDGGASWNKTSDFPLPFSNSNNFKSRDLIINPINPQKLLAATSKGVFYTWDGGISWGLCSGFATEDNTWDIAYKPGDPNIVYAVGASNTANSGYFKKSINGGIDFTTVSVPVLNEARRISMAVTPANPNKIALLAGKDGFNCFVGVFVSNDAGNSFTLTNNDNSNNLFYNYIDINVEVNQVTYNNCIAIDPANENNIFVGGVCVWGSADGGYNWTQLTAYWPASNIWEEYIHPDQHTLVFNQQGYLLVGNDGGIYKNNPAGFDLSSNGLATTQFYHFERKNKNNSLWGGAQDNGILEHGTNGNYTTFAGGDGYDMITDHNYNAANGEGNDGYLTINESLYTTCILFTICDRSVPGNTSFFGNLAMSPDDEDDIWVGYQQGLYKSTNSGINWTFHSAYPSNWCISSVKNNPNTMYVAGESSTYSGGFRVIYAGSSFDLTANLISQGYNSNLKITDIDVDPNNDDIVYISVGGTNSMSKVFQTINGGDNWTNLTFNLPNVPIFSIKRDDSNGLYVGTSIGVFYKRSGSTHWEPFSNGLPPVPVTEIELWVEGSTPQVWASTFGRGMWYTNQYNTCQSTLNLTGNIAGNQYKEAALVLSSSQNLAIGEGNIIKYNTGGKIVLTDGFKASAGSKFKTYATGCGGVVD